MKSFSKFISEDTTTSAVQVFDKPVHFQPIRRQKSAQFDVDEDTFRKFQKGRVRFERWAKFLNLQDETHKQIYDFAKKNSNGVVVLRNSTNGAMRAIRRSATNEDVLKEAPNWPTLVTPSQIHMVKMKAKDIGERNMSDPEAKKHAAQILQNIGGTYDDGVFWDGVKEYFTN